MGGLTLIWFERPGGSCLLCTARVSSSDLGVVGVEKGKVAEVGFAVLEYMSNFSLI